MATGHVPQPITPFEMGQQAAREAIARGEVPSREALDKVAAIIAASQKKPAVPDQAEACEPQGSGLRQALPAD